MNAMIKLGVGSTLVVLITYVLASAQQGPAKSPDLQGPNPFAGNHAGGQPSAQKPADNSPFGSNDAANFAQGWREGLGMSSRTNPAEAATLAKQYANTDKENESKRLAVRKQLLQLLTQQFDEHAQQQKKELAALEAEIARLNAQLNKRLAAKEKIIERRFDQLVEEAEGLGWSSPGRGQPSSYFPPSAQRP